MKKLKILKNVARKFESFIIEKNYYRVSQGNQRDVLNSFWTGEAEFHSAAFSVPPVVQARSKNDIANRKSVEKV